ncbi:hypothetical protein [Pelagicoccus sp. SDUM812003]|uniref:hypothetical protein n=1 Tax=Pelagicoccus sp. SDUM812003 TaxID=3041267 RepID=UPI0028103A50|nr:hypothetical protein [Pelagicoccus sp. SDUM812003]MDQ8204247.1 hypothetical protein [Pelagicoccus sp. SDUM812003]
MHENILRMAVTLKLSVFFGLALSISASVVLTELIFYFGFSFDLVVAVFWITFGVGGAMSYGAFRKLRISIPNGMEILTLSILLAMFVYLYRSPNEVIVGGQDPSVYYAKAVALVDYGELHKPMKSWGVLSSSTINETEIPALLGRYNYSFNGIIPEEHEGQYYLKSDFLSGPVVLHAVLGKLNRELIRYGSVLYAGMAFAAFYLLVRECTNFWTSSVGTAIFMLVPSQLFIGLSTFSEIPTQFHLLFLVLVCNYAIRVREQGPILLMTTLFLAAMSIVAMRIDGFLYVLPFALWLVVSDCLPSRRLQLFLWSIGIVCVLTFMKENHGLYFFRIYIEFPLIRYQRELSGITVALLFLLTFKELGLKRWLSYIKTIRPMWGGIFGLAIFIMLYYVRPNVEPFHEREAFGRIFRSYRENTLLNVTYTLNYVCVLLGFVGAMYMVRKEVKRVEHCSLLAYLGCFFVFAALMLYNTTASPQMYFSVRRFLPIVTPGLILIALYLVHRMRYKWLSRFLLILMVLLQMRIYAGSEYKIEMDGAERSLKNFSRRYGNDKIIVSDLDYRHVLFALVYGGKNEFIPISEAAGNNLETVKKIGHELGNKRILRVERDTSDANFVFEYERFEERYDKLPRQRHKSREPLRVSEAGSSQPGQ